MAKFTMGKVESIYTSYLSQYIRMGYTVRPDSMHPYRVDLTMGRKSTEHHIRLKMELISGYIFSSELDYLEITIELLDSHDKMIKRLSTTKFYEIERLRCYSDSEPEAVEAKKLASSRWRKRQFAEDYGRDIEEVELRRIPQSVKASIVRRIQSIWGFKRATFDCVTKIEFSRFNTGRRRTCRVRFQLGDRKGNFELK